MRGLFFSVFTKDFFINHMRSLQCNTDSLYRLCESVNLAEKVEPYSSGALDCIKKILS